VLPDMEDLETASQMGSWTRHFLILGPWFSRMALAFGPYWP